MWYVYTMEYYSAVKKNEIMFFAGKWMELQIIVLSEVSQAQKDEGCVFSLMCGIWRNRIMKTEGELFGEEEASGRGEGLKRG
jgi:hypothetical protein